jgi:Flp pilus assembly pilin Flp
MESTSTWKRLCANHTKERLFDSDCLLAEKPHIFFLRRRPPPGDEAMKTFLSRFSKKQSGVTLDEYALIAALVWVAIMIGVQVVSAGTPSGAIKIDQSKLH